MKLQQMSDEQLLDRLEAAVATELSRPKGPYPERSMQYRRRMWEVKREAERRESERTEKPPVRKKDRATRERAALLARIKAIFSSDELDPGLPPPPMRGNPDLTRLSVVQLVDRFVGLARAEEKPQGPEDAEQLYWLIDAAVSELKKRKGDQRKALLPLYLHTDTAVRFRAADVTREIAPERAESRMRAVDDPGWSFAKDKQSPRSLKRLSVAQLVERYAEIGIAQDKALLYDQTSTYNRLYGRKHAIEDELRDRDGDQRQALLALFDHPNLQVQLNAATATLALEPVAARRKLEEISEMKWAPQGGDAGMSLWNLDRGVFKPT